MASLLLRLIAALLLLLAGGFAWFVSVPPRPVSASVTADGIVVLTGAEGRIRHGADALRAGGGRRMLISGVSPGVQSHELARQADVPAQLFTCCVDLGFEATDTRSNAEEVATWVRSHNYRSLRVVTSDYHMHRALMELAAELGPEVQLLPEPVSSTASLGLYFREYLKYLVRRAAIFAGLE